MATVSVTDLKNQLSKYLRLVKQGETVEVLERGVPIARLERIQAPPGEDDGLRDRLIRDGLVSPARARPDAAILETPPIACRADPASAVVEERGDR